MPDLDRLDPDDLGTLGGIGFLVMVFGGLTAILAGVVGVGGFGVFILCNLWAWALTDQQILNDPAASWLVNPTFPLALATFCTALAVAGLGYGLVWIEEEVL